jgi:hypothetical protein
MSDFFDQLERALSDATVRRYGAPGRVPPRGIANVTRWGRARRLSHLGRRPLALALIALVIGGSAAAGVVSLVNRNSAPLTGTVPAAPGIITAGLHYDIPVTPDLEPGNVGWCSYPRFSLTASSPPPGVPAELPSSGTCGLAAVGDTPLILGGGEEGLFWMIVSSRVAALRLGTGTVIQSRTDARLPYGWRAVVTFTPAFNRRTRPLDRSSALPYPTPLDARGRPIPLGTFQPPPPVPVKTIDPSHPPARSCAIRAVALPGLRRQWEVIATGIPARRSSVDTGALFSCARSWYLFDERSPALSAALLLNAREPRLRAPALPGLTPTSPSGFFAEGGGSAGDITARRLGPAWLVVQGGTPPQRTLLLRILRLEGSPVPQAASPNERGR